MTDTILTVSSRALLLACARLGIDTTRILDAAGITRAVLEDPDARIAVHQAKTLWAVAYEVSGDPELALHAAEALPFGAYKVVDYLAAAAPSVGEALRSVSRYFPLINTAVELPLEPESERVHLCVRASADPAVLTRAYVEYTLAAVYLRTRDATGTGYALDGVDIAFPAPTSSAEHARIFGCPVRFGATYNRMTVARGAWETATVRADLSLFQVLDDHAVLLLQRLPNSVGLLSEVCAAISAELRGGDPALEHVASKMAMSERTLQRRLQDLGASYSDLLDEMRRAAATVYLADRDLSLGEVAYLLGFAEQSSFTRAFRRWTGQTPTEHRRGRS
ncbi:MAG: AraC family transcriptional regulator [Kofleriaceae bacterium]|nr:AraC family transcriptional regulator [Kofleriaceae bacterium]